MCTQTLVLVSSNLHTKLVADLIKIVLCRIRSYPYIETKKKNNQLNILILKSRYRMPYTRAIGNLCANYPVEQSSCCCFKLISSF